MLFTTFAFALPTLKETFEIDTSLKRLFKEIEHIEEKDIKPIKRYFYKEDEKLITGDGVEIALTTQFGLNFSIFISISKSLGYQIIPYAET